MKPIKLEMTAFGSYAQYTPLDFRKLEHCLYLITGDTGAGKTTIFDGIMFALYGVASGEGNGKEGGKGNGNQYRTFEMMHCDYVDKSVDTVLKLEFEHMGSIYTVERKYHYQKNRTTGEYKGGKQEAELWEPDKSVLKGSEKVTARMEELLGMSADQFRKIVMLAQGEFKKFLEAGSEEKNKILGRLFDSSAYVRFQEIFDGARKKLAGQRLEEGEKKIRNVMENFVRPEDITEEENEVYTAGHSGLEEALEKLVQKDLKERKDLEKQCEDCRKEENRCREVLGKAQEQNKKLDELDEKRRMLCELQKSLPDMERRKEHAGRVEKAFHKVMPKRVLFENAEKTYFDTVKRIEDLSEQLKGLDDDKTEKEKRLADCRQDNEPAVEHLGTEIAEIEKCLPQYADLEKKLRRRQAAGRAEEGVRGKRTAAETEKERTAEEIKKLKEQIEELNGAEAAAQQRYTALEDIKKDMNKLTAEDGIKAQADGIRAREKDLESRRAELRKLLTEAGELENAYHNAYQAFMKGQAGLLARELAQELQEKEEAVCPVCRTAFQKAASHCFAEFVEGTPEQEDVDKAKTAFEKKEKERQKKSEEITGEEAAVNGLKKNVTDRLRELKPDCPDWAGLDDASYLDEIIREYKSRREKAEEEYNKAKEQCRALEKWKKECSEKEKEQEKRDADIRDNRKEEETYKMEISTLNGEISALKESLKYPGREEAEKRKGELRKEKEQRTEKIRKAEEGFQKVKEQFDSVFGALKSNEESLPNCQRAKERAEEALRAEIEAQGFQNFEEVQTLLEQAMKETWARSGQTPEETWARSERAPREDLDVESWLKSENDRIKNYENDLFHTERRTKELEKDTKHLERVDLDRLEDKINELEKAYEGFQNQLNICKRQYDNHVSTWETVREANKFLKETEGAWNRLNSLANLAMGENSAGGILSFDRYVMGYVFREVLDMANQRLDIMSGGRYELMHERGAYRANAKAGLEIEVLDMTTGKSRPVSSLSGGESFFVSLALALGLSDVVQNHAGGKRLDALFIDEGFGTLDNDVLDHALAVLNQLTEGKRLVGIISHVEKLKESIPQQIRIRNSAEGSSLKIVN